MKRAACLVGLLALAGAPSAAAGCVTGCDRQESASIATSWSGDAKAPTRLILATPSHNYGGPVWIALEIDVARGWYVYASPDSEGAPRFEWAGSSNLAPPVPRWPRPDLVEVDGRHKHVYKGRVILPVSIAPIQPDEDVEIGLHVSYAVCSDICRPGYAVHTIHIAAAPVPPPPAARHQADDIARAVAATVGP